MQCAKTVLGADLSTMYRGLWACGHAASLRWQVLQFIEIAHEHSQTESRSRFGVTGHELFLVVIKIEIEWVLRIHIDQHQVRIGHRELAEA